ncbi:hypothetical protein LAZ67_11002055 [Cordylochernes scorpioides]|uniref:Reverse transcriptase domain-containing protein n=1 Tax=Cordylochernes scorpioides TaxID=51811 RepID=A0ABY6KYW6_9ARAC|nr:hypothetical protein LAZ67_11002055 [Cordylochernes scorpioides]
MAELAGIKCPFGKECDANVESHFMRYNHTFEDRATFILLSPVKPKKRKWNLSRTPTKSPRTSRTPVKSPRTPRLATPNKPSNKKLKTTQTPSTSKQHASHNNFTECTSSTLDESQPVKDESKLNATRKFLFITVSSDEEEQGNGKEVLEQGATDHPVAPKEENIVIECSPDIPNECSPPESKSQLEKNDTEFSDQNIPEECFPPDGNPLLDIDNDNFFNQHDEKQKENSLPNGSKPREKVQKTITFFFGSNTSSHPPQNLPEKPPAGCKPGPTSARRFNGTRSYNSTPSSSGSSLSQGPQQSKSREQQNSSEKRCPFYKKIKSNNFEKLFTSILRTRLIKWIENRNIISENQAGFRSAHSCQDHFFYADIYNSTYSKKKKEEIFIPSLGNNETKTRMGLNLRLRDKGRERKLRLMEVPCLSHDEENFTLVGENWARLAPSLVASLLLTLSPRSSSLTLSASHWMGSSYAFISHWL